MLRVVVLISGGGSNLRALFEACRNVDYPAHIVAVGSDLEADGFAHAQAFGVPTFSVPLTSYPTREAWGEELLCAIREWEPDLVVLSGFMRLLPAGVVDSLAPALINTHPSYLPEFPGAHGVHDALAAGVTQTGASIIVVDSGIDTGPILAQERVAVLPHDTEHSLHERIKPVERRLLINAVRDIATGASDLRAASAAP